MYSPGTLTSTVPVTLTDTDSSISSRAVAPKSEYTDPVAMVTCDAPNIDNVGGVISMTGRVI